VAALRSAGVSPHSLTTDLFWRYNPATQSADRRGQALRVIRTLCRVAADYAITTVVVFPGMQESRAPYDATYAAAVQTLQISARYALEYGVTIAIENVPTSFLQSPREFSGLLRDIGSPAVRACININNVIAAGQVYPENWILALNDFLVLAHAHIVEAARASPPATGVSIDWDVCLEALREVRYQGPLILGLPPGPTAERPLPPPRDVVSSAVHRIKDLCDKYGADSTAVGTTWV
jgi:sugar phosphate isomerase/epimerase